MHFLVQIFTNAQVPIKTKNEKSFQLVATIAITDSDLAGKRGCGKTMQKWKRLDAMVYDLFFNPNALAILK